MKLFISSPKPSSSFSWMSNFENAYERPSKVFESLDKLLWSNSDFNGFWGGLGGAFGIGFPSSSNTCSSSLSLSSSALSSSKSFCSCSSNTGSGSLFSSPSWFSSLFSSFCI